MEKNLLKNKSKSIKSETKRESRKTFAFSPLLLKAKIGDTIFNSLLKSSGYFIIILIVAFLATLFISALPSIKKFGFGFFTSSVWDPRADVYGALAFIVGTLLTSLIALAISLPFSMSISILLSQYLKRGFLANAVKIVTELLAGIPSVIYGFWGFMFLSPLVKNVAKWLFGIEVVGYGVLTSSIVLAIMIVPYCASISREVIDLVPKDLQEAAYALGATKFEVITTIVLPYAFSGIFAGIVLSLGRALGETMAVTMVIGNRNELPSGLLSPANTIASVIANNFNEADGLMMS
ncbi:MAG TPA: phosphate ABC transporter permease subunit PstC, partial [Spirochaetota bacterium]|nr:phosphate ABC transporter permease subunit PstC [Spirochaetota bacterium]